MTAQIPIMTSTHPPRMTSSTSPTTSTHLHQAQTQHALVHAHSHSIMSQNPNIYNDPTAWHSASPFAPSPSNSSKSNTQTNSKSISPVALKSTVGSSPANDKGGRDNSGNGNIKQGESVNAIVPSTDETDVVGQSDFNVSNGPMKSHPPPDPRYPYASLLQPIPIDLPPQNAHSVAYPTSQPSTYFPDSSVLETPLAEDAYASSYATTGQRAHPSKDDILRRHSLSTSYWDDPSPDAESSSHLANKGATINANAVASSSTPDVDTPTTGSKPSGRSGQKRRQKYTRTRTGCLCCRSRRIKCDETRPVCKRCVIAKKEYPDPGEAPQSDTPTGKRSKGDFGSRSSSEASDQSDHESRPVAKQRRVGSKDRRSRSPQAEGDQTYSSPDDPQANTSNGLNYGWDASFVGSTDNVTPSSLGASASSTLLAAGAGTLDSGYDLAGVIGKQPWGAAQGGAPMLTTPNFLLPWFPTAEERSLILHYCANAASLMMAIPSGLNPMLAINLPLALDSPRGLNPSADALRVALLGIGAIHQAFLLARSGVANSQTAAMFQYASTLRDTGKEMVRRAVRNGNGALTDAALGAGTALSTIDIFFGGSGWMDNFSLAKEMVALRGGPAEMLKNSEPRKLTDGVTVSPARLMLEILAIYETFSCLTTGQEPTLISDLWASWWLEGSRSTYEEHSVEKQFGMSRVMVLLFTRVTRLLARAARSNAIITEFDSSLPLSSDPGSTSSPYSVSAHGLSSLGSGLVGGSVSDLPLPTGSKYDDPLVAEARQLNRDVDAWIESLQLSTLEHERVQVGNRAYAYAMKILLLRKVFKYPRDDIRVQNAAQQVLQHCSWSTAALGMSIDLTWPAVIAGSCIDGTSRQWVLTLLEGFKSQCCFDIETAGRILSEVWRRADTNGDRADWKEVCDDLGLQVLLC